MELSQGWGKQHKYCLKANWIDCSQARNVVSGKIYSEIVHYNRKEDEISSLYNGGVVDGFPCVVYLNGDFLGLYTLNIPKDKWMFGIKKNNDKQQAILFGNTWADSVALKEPIAEDFSNGWTLEYCSTDDTAWVVSSFNRMMSFVNNNDGEDFINGIEEFADVGRAIDTFLYTAFICGYDNVSKNMNWVTYDGIKWFPSVYDMDDSWGLVWDGQSYYAANSSVQSFLGNSLWKKIFDNFYPQIAERYSELRNSVLSIYNIDKQFSSFFSVIPSYIWLMEREKWQDVPSQSTNSFFQIIDFAVKRISSLDEFFGFETDEKLHTVCFDVSSCDVYLFNSRDYDLKADLYQTFADENAAAYARDPQTGLVSNDDNGEVNFYLDIPDGYQLDSINIDGSYQALETIEEGGRIIYRISGISGDLQVINKLSESN